MNEQALATAKRLCSRLGDTASSPIEDDRGVVIKILADSLPEALVTLKTDPETPFDILSSIIGVDWSTWHEETGFGSPPARFSLMYNLYSTKATARLFLEVSVAEGQVVPTVVPQYASANWSEREVFDMFGIKFKGHPDLRRIYLKDDFAGHPLRKEFPRRGLSPQDDPQE